MILRITRQPGARSRGRLSCHGRILPCALGKGGISSFKREGDGATPRGRFPLRRVWLRRDGALHGLRPTLPLRFTQQADGWCDDPGHRLYNRPVVRPFQASHEAMWRDDALYDAVIEIGWNDHPAIRGRGSAIFMHIARPGYTPTEGCIALTVRDMRWLLPRLTSRTSIEIS